MNEHTERYPDPAEIAHRIGATGQLTINNVSGEVELRAVDGDEVTVFVRSESGRSEWLPLTVRKDDGSLTIDVEKRGTFAMFGTWFGSSDGMEFEVSVPRVGLGRGQHRQRRNPRHFLSGEQSYKSVSGDSKLSRRWQGARRDRVGRHRGPGAASQSSSTPTRLGRRATSKVRSSSRFDARTVSGDVEFKAGFARRTAAHHRDRQR